MNIEGNTIPRSTGPVDHSYLEGALHRAGLLRDDVEFVRNELNGGRTGARVERVLCGTDRFILKQSPVESWRNVAMNCPQGGEALLWHSGATRALSGEIRCPTIDVEFDEESGLYRILMHDVAPGMRGRGEFSLADTRRLFRGLAVFHAEHANQAPRLVMPTAADTINVFRQPLLHLAGRLPDPEPWVTSFLSDFQVMGAFLPLFRECLGEELDERFLDLVADERWLAMLQELPATLVHGDLRRANIAFDKGHLELFDWEFAAIGPPATDLQWHVLLHYWGYPPNDVEAGYDCAKEWQEYIEVHEKALGHKLDREQCRQAWDLGWIATIVKLGYTLVDPLYPDGGSNDTRVRTEALCQRAVRHALQCHERWVK